MKRIWTLLAFVAGMMSATAQEIWNANAVTDLETAEQTIEATANITLKIASILNGKDIQDGKTPWKLNGAADGSSNTALNTDDCSPKFTQYLMGMGNPYVEDAGGSWETNSNGDPVWRDDPNAVKWTPGCGKLPLHGMYLVVTTKAAGTMRMGVYINKGNHPLYIVDAATGEHLPNTAIEVEFYYQNNTFGSMIKGTMPADYIIQHTNGETQNRPALGYITFDVEAGKSYWVFNPSSQVGLYGFYFTQGGNSEVTATLKVSPEGAGSVSPTTTTILSGTSFTATATANAGYAFSGWQMGGEQVATDNPHTFTLTADTEITAVFSEQPAHVLKGFVHPDCTGMGTVSVSPEGTAVVGGRKFNHGTTVTLTATPAKGYQFDRWVNGSGETIGSNAKLTLTVTEDGTIYAVFQPLENYKAGIVSFPGAQGYGRFTTGGRPVDGRGARVYYVTRLDDTGEVGTFRWAVSDGDDTPRTVLFNVAGTIFLKKNVDVRANTTIAGQTAPGGGICLAGYRVKLGSNVIVRHVRFRAGDLPKGSMSPLGMENVQHIMLDHCSISWSMEENLTAYDNDSTTVQWCILSEPLYYSKNIKGSRGYGAQWGGEHSTMHHCLFAHCVSRSPRFNGVRTENHDRQVDSEFFNNVIYNWGSAGALYGGENYITETGIDPEGAAPHYDRIYMIGNYFRPGPATKAATANRRYFVRPSGGNINMIGQWYLSGNKFELSSKWAPSTNIWSDAVLQKVNDDNYYGFLTSSRAIDFQFDNSQAVADKALMKEIPYELSGLTAEAADDAYQKVIRQAGASLPRYDEVDCRILAESAGTLEPQFSASHGTMDGVIDSPYDITLKEHDILAALDEATNTEIDVTCYPRLHMDGDDCRVIDSDGDGLPDAYELEVGLNPNDPNDGQQLTESGYSNLEVFLNGVADGEIDMTQFTKHQPVTMTDSGFNTVVAQDASGNYETIQAAIDAAPADGTPYYVFVKAGTYDGHVQINRPNIHLTGQSKQDVVIEWDKTIADGNIDNTATVNVTASDVSFDNLTIRNTRLNAGQALALYTKADRVSITSCNLEGWQDTYRTGKQGQRHIVRNTKISGTTDFIYNDGEVFFDADTLHVLRQSNVITAPAHNNPKYGYVFRNCVITAAQQGAQTHLGRPWTDTPKVSFIDTRLTEGVSIPAEGWQNMGAYPIQMAEYNTMDAKGNAIDLSNRRTAFTVDGNTKDGSKAVLTPVEAQSYQLDYMLRGQDEWDADWIAFILPQPTLAKSDGRLTWSDPTGFAMCYLLIQDGKATLTTDTQCTYTEGQQVSVQLVSQSGVLGEAITPEQTTSGICLLTTDGASVVNRHYFTADGRRTTRLQHGVTIVRETLSNGTQRTTKILSK